MKKLSDSDGLSLIQEKIYKQIILVGVCPSTVRRSNEVAALSSSKYWSTTGILSEYQSYRSMLDG